MLLSVMCFSFCTLAHQEFLVHSGWPLVLACYLACQEGLFSYFEEVALDAQLALQGSIAL